MLPEPLHPAVVHFPVVFSVALPFVAVVALWAVHRGADRRLAWFVPVVIAVAMTASGWFAKETGEDQEETVEQVVPEEPLHEHEEAAELFLVVAGVTTLLMAGGLAAGRIGSAARVVGTAASLVALAAGVRVGDLGGELVYVHGAAGAYVDGSPAAGEPEGGGSEEAGEEGGEDDDEGGEEGGDDAG